MAAPTRNAVQALTGNTGTTSYSPSLTTLTTGAQVGDVICIFLAMDGNPSLSIAGTGWSIEYQQADATNACKIAHLHYTVVTAGTVPAFTLTLGASEAITGYGIRVRSSTGVLGFINGTPSQGSSTNPNPPAVTNSTGGAIDAYIMAHWGGDAVVASTAAPANYANHSSATISNSANGCAYGTADRTITGMANAASEDPGVFTRAIEQWVSNTVLAYEIQTVAEPLVASASFSFGSAASLSPRRGLVAAGPVSFGSAAVLRETSRLVAAATFSFGSAATLKETSGLVGSGSISFGSSAVLSSATVTEPLAASSSIAFDSATTLTRARKILAATSFTFGSSASLTEASRLAATGAFSFGSAAALGRRRGTSAASTLVYGSTAALGRLLGVSGASSASFSGLATLSRWRSLKTSASFSFSQGVYGPNLVPNGDASDGLTGWLNQYGTGTPPGTLTVEGGRFKVTNDGAAGLNYGWRNIDGVAELGKTYRFQADHEVNRSGAALVRVFSASYSKMYLFRDNYQGNNAGLSFSYDVSFVHDGTHPSISIFLGIAQTFNMSDLAWFDNVQLREEIVQVPRPVLTNVRGLKARASFNFNGPRYGDELIRNGDGSSTDQWGVAAGSPIITADGSRLKVEATTGSGDVATQSFYLNGAATYELRGKIFPSSGYGRVFVGGSGWNYAGVDTNAPDHGDFVRQFSVQPGFGFNYEINIAASTFSVHGPPGVYSEFDDLSLRQVLAPAPPGPTLSSFIASPVITPPDRTLTLEGSKAAARQVELFGPLAEDRVLGFTGSRASARQVALEGSRVSARELDLVGPPIADRQQQLTGSRLSGRTLQL